MEELNSKGNKDSWLYIIFFAFLLIDILQSYQVPRTTWGGKIVFHALYLLIAHKVHQKLMKKMPLFWSALLSIIIGQLISGFLVGFFG